MKKHSTIRSRTLARLQRGQAMIEYSFVSHVLLFVGGGLGWVFTINLLNALNKFYDSIYFVMSSSVP